ncbi:MAG: ABC transporter ATP-binding protein [Archangium gephyra]|uniref:ABC transporter ATP-binding protein n=1 Tax=Archangium gephyra TaxID=48 RepID=A0A2W5SQG6_9BACT|nr:MAG: ABC transporter ATP-binding protein [Archangium gephyra]
MKPVIEVDSIVRDFGAARAVDGVSFEVASGEVVGLLGPNGAGKTTTLRVLAGLLTPQSGSARIAGHDVKTAPLEARRHLGFLTASTGLYERLTGREVLTVFGRLQGLSEEALARRIDLVGAELELTPFLDKRCGALSSGQKQRISIARAVVHDPAAYVLDEPTATLDPVASRDILELVQRAKARGKAVLFSTHRMEEAQYLCTRLVFMRGGRVVARGTATELLQQSGKAELTDAFLHFAGALP